MQIPRRKSEELRRRDEGPVYITEAGLKRLKEKMARLKAALPERIAEAQRTAAYGDRSENAEYKEAKGILRRTHWQILGIEDQIRRAALITPGSGASGAIQIGSTVVLGLDGKRKTFQILGSQEADPDRGRISNQSPLGAALLGHKKGDSVTVQTGRGSKQYQILEVR